MKITLRVASLKVKITILLSAVFLIVGLAVGFFVWKELGKNVREVSRQKLISIAQTSAVMIDGDRHKEITEEQNEDSAYVHEILKKAIAANPGVDDVYTLKKTGRRNIWEFVSSGYETFDKNNDGKIEDYERAVEYGEEYDVTELPEMKKAFSGPSADYEISCDSWGCWLSGYAPIFDSSGKAVAVLGVDIPAENIINYEKRSLEIIISVLAFLALLFALVMFLSFRIISRPAFQIISGIGEFSRDMDSRIKVDSGDEFELIADSFNMLASELQRRFFKENSIFEAKRRSQFSYKDGKKILVIENDESLQTSLIEKLSESGFEVIAVSDGESGLEKAFKLHPHLIVMDIIMPKLDGVEFLKKLKKDFWGVNAPVVVLANISDYKKLEEALSLGVDEYIIKAKWNMEDFSKKVKNVLGMR